MQCEPQPDRTWFRRWRTISQIDFAPDTALSFPITLLKGWGVILLVAVVPFVLIRIAQASGREDARREPMNEPVEPHGPAVGSDGEPPAS